MCVLFCRALLKTPSLRHDKRSEPCSFHVQKTTRMLFRSTSEEQLGSYLDFWLDKEHCVYVCICVRVSDYRSRTHNRQAVSGSEMEIKRRPTHAHIYRTRCFISSRIHRVESLTNKIARSSNSGLKSFVFHVFPSTWPCTGRRTRVFSISSGVLRPAKSSGSWWSKISSKEWMIRNLFLIIY